MSSQSSAVKRLILGASVGMAIAFGANAQLSSGHIAGTASAGDIVVVQGKGTGWHRELKIKKDGKYQVRMVPTGEYIVTVTHADGRPEPRKLVVVNVGTTTRVK